MLLDICKKKCKFTYNIQNGFVIKYASRIDMLLNQITYSNHMFDWCIQFSSGDVVFEGPSFFFLRSGHHAASLLSLNTGTSHSKKNKHPASFVYTLTLIFLSNYVM